MSQKTISKSMLIFKSNPGALTAPEQFLRNRDWKVLSATDIKAGLAMIVEKKPSFVLISMDHRSPAVRKLPKLLIQAFPVCIIGYVENSNSKSFRLLADSQLEYKVNPPVTGPAIERAVNKYLRDQEKGTSEVKKPKAELSIKQKAKEGAAHISGGAINIQQGNGSVSVGQDNAPAGFTIDDQKSGGELNYSATHVEHEESDTAYSLEAMKQIMAQATGHAEGGEAGLQYTPNENDEAGYSIKPIEGESHSPEAKRAQPGEEAMSYGDANDKKSGEAGSFSYDNEKRPNEHEDDFDAQDESGEHHEQSGSFGPNRKKRNGAAGSLEGGKKKASNADMSWAPSDVATYKEDDFAYDDDTEKKGESSLGYKRKHNKSSDGESAADDAAAPIVAMEVENPKSKRKKSDSSDSHGEHSDKDNTDGFGADNDENAGSAAELNSTTAAKAKSAGSFDSNSDVDSDAGSDSGTAGSLVRRRKHQMTAEQNSLISEGVGRALIESSDGVVKQNDKITENSNVACIIVESEKFSGYLITAMGKDRRIDAQFIKKIQDKLFQFLVDNGEKIQKNENVQLKIKVVDFEDWALEYAEFLRKSIHDGSEVAMAFFPTKAPRVELGDSSSPDMNSLSINELEPDKPVEFNVYIYLPANNKYLLYTPKGSVFYKKQKDRLQSQNIQKVHMLKSETEELTKYKVQNYLNNLIEEYNHNNKSKVKSA